MEIEFVPSNEYIDRMKKRAELSCNSVKDETKCVNSPEIEEGIKILPDLITGYHHKDVSSTD